MTNFNHDAIANGINAQIEECFQEGGWTNNDTMAARLIIAHRFVKTQIAYLIENGPDQFAEAIKLYIAALEETTFLGKMFMDAPEGKESMSKAGSLVKGVLVLMTDELEGGNAGDLDLVWRTVMQAQLFNLYKHMKQAAGTEAAELVVTINNAITLAVNAELDVANAA